MARETARAAGEEKSATTRLSLPLSPDGSIDWEHVRGSTVEKFLGILKTDSKIQSEFVRLKDEHEEAASLFEGVTQENVSKALDGVARINATLMAIVGAKWIKHPLLRDPRTNKPLPFTFSPEALQRMEFTPKQHAELDPRAHKVAQRYSGKLPDWLKEHLDLYILGSMFIAYTAENAKACMGVQIAIDYQHAQERARANVPRSVPLDSDKPKEKGNGHDENPPLEFRNEPFPQGENEAPGA